MTSGHYEKYGADSFQPIQTPADGEEFLLKPMNCPHHCEIYKTKPWSYRDLPKRYAEFGTVYRYEQSGELHGLTRVRGFTQDDAHIFCMPEQLAYLGIVQRFKSRFRITTNGGQCISCGNCSTYCEQGIDVRAYAQKGENIVRSSCVGCGVCSAVCPRGVLKLENGPEKGRINPTEILLGNDVDLIQLLNKK